MGCGLCWCLRLLLMGWDGAGVPGRFWCCWTGLPGLMVAWRCWVNWFGCWPWLMGWAALLMNWSYFYGSWFPCGWTGPFPWRLTSLLDWIGAGLDCARLVGLLGWIFLGRDVCKWMPSPFCGLDCVMGCHWIGLFWFHIFALGLDLLGCVDCKWMPSPFRGWTAQWAATTLAFLITKFLS